MPWHLFCWKGPAAESLLRHKWIPGFAAVLLGPWLLAQPAPVHYVIDTEAGYVPADQAVALAQYLDAPAAVAYDARNTLYFATLSRIWRSNSDGTITPIAGSAPGAGGAANGDGGLATQALLSTITALAFDGGQNLYVAEHCKIWRIAADGTISTFAGTGAYPGLTSNAGGPASSVGICPAGLAVSASMLYATDWSSSSIIAFSLDGKKSAVIAGNNGYGYSGDGGPAIKAQFGSLGGLALWNNMLLTIDSYAPDVLRQIDLSTGIVSSSGAVVQACAGLFCYAPDRVAVSSDGKAYFNDFPFEITQLDLQTGVSQVFVTESDANVFPPAIEYVRGLAVNSVSGSLAIADTGTHLISVTGTDDRLQTVAGVVHFGGDNGPAVLALLDGIFVLGPQGVALGPDGLYFSDGNNNRVRKVTPDGLIHTIAGTGLIGFSGDGGPAVAAHLNQPTDVKFDASGNLYVADSGNRRVRKIDPSGTITTVAGSGSFGGNLPTNGVMATSASLDVRALALDARGNLYVAGSPSAQVWRVDAAGVLSLFAGATVSGGFSGDGGPAVDANLSEPACMATDGSGNLYICDLLNNRVRKVDSKGKITTAAGNGNMVTGSVSNGTATSVAIGQIVAATVDSTGNLYLGAGNTGQILRVDTSGQLTVIGGKPGATLITGDGGDAIQAGIEAQGLAADAGGNIFVAEIARIRKLTPVGPGGPPPFVAFNGVIGAAGSVPPISAISPGGLGSIYGLNFYPIGNSRTALPSDLVNDTLPTNLGGVCVTIGGIHAPLLYVNSTQINFQAPSLAPEPQLVQVTAHCGTPGAVVSNYGAAMSQAASPEFFSFAPDSTGVNPVAAINARTGVFIGPPGLLPGHTFVGAKAGDIITAFGTGWGLTTPAVSLGLLPSVAARVSATPSLTLGGIPVPASEILYAGVAPHFAGLYQLNFVVPSTVPPGNQALIMTLDGVSSPYGAFLTVQ
jgi:uncharacterized protein (TIGR03437 family)